MEKTTPLTAWHQAHHGQMVPFGGYLMPVQYEQGILHEHHLIRQKVGLFDVSHMGEFWIKGPDALANLNRLLSNDFSSLEIGFIRYGVLVRQDGSAVDDVLVYHWDVDVYLVVVNASNIDKDERYFREHLKGQVDFINASLDYGQIALQGPLAEQLLSKLTSEIPSVYYSFKPSVQIEGMDVLISRTGYTGEDGFELYVKAEDTVRLWELLLEHGQNEGCEPCGLGARDTLRLEAAMPLFGHELSDTITPLEAGLKSFVRLDKADFIAQEALSNPPTRRRIGLVMVDRGIAREGSDVFIQDNRVGYITSGTFSPSLDKAIAMALIDSEFIDETQFEVDVRGRKIHAEKVKLPFYKR